MPKIRRFSWIFVKHLYTISILLVSDPFDIAGRWFHVNYQPPQFLFWVLLVIAIGSALYLSLRSYKSTTDKANKNLVIRERLIDILGSIEKRDLQLKDVAVRQYKALFSLEDFKAFCKCMTYTKKEHTELLKSVEKEIGRKKLKQDKIKRRRQIDDVSEKLSPIKEMEWTLEKATAYGNELDVFPKMQNSKYKGIKTRREKDKRWEKLFANLSNMKTEFSNNELDKMINEYVNNSFVSSSICLHVELFNWYIAVDIQPTAYIDTGTYAPYVEIQNHMTRLREGINNKIRELAPESDFSFKRGTIKE